MEAGQYMEAIVEGYGTNEWKGTINVRLLGVDSSVSLIEHVRMLMPFVNKNQGCYILPELKDLVYIVFTNQSLSEAICVGSPIPLKAALTKHMKQDNTLKQIQTKGGFMISVSDQKNQEQLEIKSKKGLMIKLDDQNETVSIGDSNEQQLITIDLKNKSVKLKAKEALTITNGDASIKLNKTTLEVKATTIKMDCTSLHVKTKKETTMNSVKTTIKSTNKTVVHGAMCEVSADAKQVLKGGLIQIG